MYEKTIDLSIVIPTLNRKKEVEELLESIDKTKKNITYEIIVIDQNTDNLIDSICDQYKKYLPLCQYHVQFKGLSRARNYGVKLSKGNVVCFPDDDAKFSEVTIENALSTLNKKKAACVFGKTIDEVSGKDSIVQFDREEAKLTIEHFEGKFVEATMFAYRELLLHYPFDEHMGIGEIFGSQEGFDLVYRMLKDNASLYYSPDIVFFHPQKTISKTTSDEIKRAFYYSCGLGYLCYKHKFNKRYGGRLFKLKVGIPIIALFRHNQLKYYEAQKMGLVLGYKYLV